MAATLALLHVVSALLYSGIGTEWPPDGTRVEDDMQTEAIARVDEHLVDRQQLCGRLLEGLSSNDWHLRYTAVLAFGCLGDPMMMDVLIGATFDPDVDVRLAAVRALGQSECPTALPALVQALRDEHPRIRTAAVRALAVAGGHAVIGVLVDRLGDRQLSIEAIEALAWIGGPEVNSQLASSLGSPDWRMREATVRALGRASDSHGIDKLIAALSDTHPYVVAAAVQSLDWLGGARVTTALIEALQESLPGVSSVAVSVLETVRDEDSIGQLIEALSDPRPTVRATAACSLGRIGIPHSVQPLIAALRDVDARVRAEAAIALGEIGEEGAVGGLAEAVRDSEEAVRFSAASAIGQVGSEAGVAALIAALQDPASTVRTNAVLALGAIADSAAVPHLSKLLHDRSPQVRDATTRAIKLLEDTTADGRADSTGTPDSDADSGPQYPFDSAALMRDLSANDVRIRRMAAKQLGAIPNEATVSALIRALDDADESVRASAARSLGRLRRSEALGPLVSVMRQQRGFFVARAALDIFHAVHQSVEPLDPRSDDEDRREALLLRVYGAKFRFVDPIQVILALDDSSESVRRSAALVLGSFGDAVAVRPLIATLQDVSPIVREAAAKALGMIGKPESLEPLLLLLHDHSGSVRSAAASALGRIGHGDAAPELRGHLQYDTRISSPGASWEDARPSIAWALGRLRDSLASECLLSCLEDSNPYLRFSAARALGEIANPRLVQSLRTLAMRESEASNMAAFALLLMQQAKPA